MLGFLNKNKSSIKQQRLDEQIERSESAFNAALGAEARNNQAAAEHFLRLAIREEEKAFSNG